MTTVGVLGGGQLGRMLALAGYPLDLRFRFLDPAATAPVDGLGERVRGDYTDAAALARFAAGVDVFTYEFENVPVGAARQLERFAPVFPAPDALAVAQDRLTEKTFFRDLGIRTAPFVAVETWADLERAVATVGLPAVLKTRRMGYDGKGQWVMRSPEDVATAWAALGGAPLLVEGFVAFDRECSVLAARGQDGAIACYPVVANTHRDGILRRSLAPAPGLARDLETRAEDLVGRALTALGYVGVLAVELFQVGDEFLVNEMAPRVHNSGHWTIEGAETSQFENHLRAICGLPLGSTVARGYSAMLNLIGGAPDLAATLATTGAHAHLYGKAARRGRKVGHITVRADDPMELAQSLAALEPLVAATADG